ncbi:hypothetical protein ST37_01000 (plasmid) [Vibrio sp. qd031]|uniref:bifunctional protein-serine/threonine kinase/phosphatase n=1 Tax=Vibrio sp. qd031 TaxID=1603038 RepID=UPI000A23B597|nr:bifunctional protein-serine/threonine kinase/phosphatase [Vibrio sp. qd031]ORT52403.1 hypothetical protein ST37_01000 [Vibrio sp. qd031]
MSQSLELYVGSATNKGNKPVNQDAIVSVIPKEPVIQNKGAVFAVADGISSSLVSDQASQTAVAALANDYYSTPDAWSTKNSALKVISATNAWLHAQSMKTESRFDLNTGYVCTLSALIIKSHTAYIFHCGDSRIYHLAAPLQDKHAILTQLTQDHRTYQTTQSYLANAMGLHSQIHLDFHEQSISVGDSFLLASDGVFDFVSEQDIVDLMSQLSAHDCAQQLVSLALKNGSNDNLSAVVVEVKQLPSASFHELQMQGLKAPKQAAVGHSIDGFELIRELYVSSRSHVFLASRKQENDDRLYALKVLSTELSHDQTAIEALLMEEWVGQRVRNPHLLSFPKLDAPKTALYVVSDFIKGSTLERWMLDNPEPDLESVRRIVAQVAKGLQAMHRQEMVHQDLRPANIMIDAQGTVMLVDFGATRVAGLVETDTRPSLIMGTAQYSAPEYFLGDVGSSQSDLFSLAVITYQMLTGKLPYGTGIAKCHTSKQLQSLQYVPLASHRDDVPNWVDYCIKKGCDLRPDKRQLEVSEFVSELEAPSLDSRQHRALPIIEKNPIMFWQRCCLVLFVMLLVALWH